jgi:hypothetical protein
MKMLTILSADRRNARQARDDEPCVPNFGVCGRNLFVGLATDGLSSCATVGEVPDKDLDDLWEAYKKNYPAIPEGTLKEYLFSSVDAGNKFAPGKRLRVSHPAEGGVRIYETDGPAYLENPKLE